LETFEHFIVAPPRSRWAGSHGEWDGFLVWKDGRQGAGKRLNESLNAERESGQRESGEKVYTPTREEEEAEEAVRASERKQKGPFFLVIKRESIQPLAHAASLRRFSLSLCGPVNTTRRYNGITVQRFETVHNGTAGESWALGAQCRGKLHVPLM